MARTVARISVSISCGPESGDRPGFQREIPGGSKLTTPGAAESVNAARPGRTHPQVLALPTSGLTIHSQSPACSKSRALQTTFMDLSDCSCEAVVQSLKQIRL